MKGFVTTLLILTAASSVMEGQAPSAPTGPLTLAEAIERGRLRGVNAVLGRINERMAAARAAQRRSDLLPTINGAARVVRQTLNLDEFGIPIATGVTPAFNIYSLRLRASQTLFDASLITRLHAATDSAAAAGFDAQAVGEIAGATAGLAYLRLQSGEETVNARLADSAVATALLDQARQLVNAGVSPAIDETRSEVSLSAVRTQLEVARNQRDRARLDLARAMDLPATSPIELADSLGTGALEIPVEPEAAVAFAMEHRPEVAAEQKRTDAISKTLKSIGYENLPSLAAAGEYIESGRQPSTLAGTYNIGLQVSIPVLDGFKRQNRSKEQTARLDAQRERMHDLSMQIETEARQAMLDLSSAEQQIALAAERLRLAEAELSQAAERFKAGVAGSVETTTAETAVIDARDALIQSRVNYGTARVSAYRALGVLDRIH